MSLPKAFLLPVKSSSASWTVGSKIVQSTWLEKLGAGIITGSTASPKTSRLPSPMHPLRIN